MKSGAIFQSPVILSSPDNWIPSFPNPADFRFDYFKLMQTSPDGLAQIKSSSPKHVAVIGAGAAGMTVARELFRCGCSVTIFEASSRIGGRLYTYTNPNGTDQTGMEMGAMRMPFFASPGSKNSLLDYYLNFEVAKTNPLLCNSFPNPGNAKGGTGVYMNDGLGPDLCYSKPTMIPWKFNKNIDNTILEHLSQKTDLFGKNFSIASTMYYTKESNEWETCWQKIVSFYDPYTFNELALMPAFSKEYITDKLQDLSTFDGNLGGMGFLDTESDLLAVIGTGDGSWGAFFAISCLWFIRCSYFGFSTDLQTIEGFSNPGTFLNGQTEFQDKNGNSLETPNFQGIQSLVEYLYYAKAPGSSTSLYESATLYTDSPVSKITKTKDGISITYGDKHSVLDFDDVVLTSTQWAAQMSITFEGFDNESLPLAKLAAQNTQHNISSCKLFFPLKEKYWENPDNVIPQIIITDTIIQDMYGLNWSTQEDDNGILLASYTWEDDSLKLLPFDEKALSELVLNKLKQITLETTGQDITEYIQTSKPVTIQWIKEPSYVGCAKLYRPKNQIQNLIDLSYNQEYSKESHLFFAGENYGVEGGWTETALRSALDCVMQFLNNYDAKFNNPAFVFDRDYPKWITVTAN